MKPQSTTRARWYAARSLPIPDSDELGVESVTIWVERRDGGEWAVGRASDLDQRTFAEPRDVDYAYSGFDLDDVLQHANELLEDDVTASEMDGIDTSVLPFTRGELEEPLADWFWGRRTA